MTLEEQLITRATQKNIPISGVLELLPLCNMNCDMCYIRLSPEELASKGRIRTYEEWSDLAVEMRKHGVLFLLLTGGEPLLYPEFKKLYTTLINLGFIITLNTNGTLIDEETSSFLAQNKPRRVNITLYGKDSDTYQNLCHYRDGFRQTMQGIKLLKKYHVDVKLNGSLTKMNLNDIDSFIDIANELEVPIQIDTYMFPASRERSHPFLEDVRLSPKTAALSELYISKRLHTPENFEKYCQQIRQQGEASLPKNFNCSSRCRAGKSSFVINWLGNMTPCIMLTNPSINVFEHGFEKSWEHTVNAVQKIITSNICASCKRRNICQTCIASAYYETGTYNGTPQYLCQYSETLYVNLEQQVHL